MSGTYVTDLRHFLDECGEIVKDMPADARQLASFLALIVDEVSRCREHAELSLRCRKPTCPGTIVAINESGEIHWQCPVCNQNGVIRNWRGTKWDQCSVE